MNNAVFASLNRNKRSVEIDTKSEAGCRMIYDLVAQSDVIVDDFRAGVMRRLGCDCDTLSRINPAIICASGTGFGEVGPVPTRAARRAGPGHDRVREKTRDPTAPKIASPALSAGAPGGASRTSSSSRLCISASSPRARAARCSPPRSGSRRLRCAREAWCPVPPPSCGHAATGQAGRPRGWRRRAKRRPHPRWQRNSAFVADPRRPHRFRMPDIEPCLALDGETARHARDHPAPRPARGQLSIKETFTSSAAPGSWTDSL